MIAPLGRPGVIGGQMMEITPAAQSFFPEIEPLGQCNTFQSLVLPTGEVCIFKGQLGEWGGLPCFERPVQEREFSKEDPCRPIIPNDVVGPQDQNMILRRDSHQTGSQQGAVGQIKWL